MSTQGKNETLSVILGAVTAAGVGTFLLQALGAFILGLIGALAGWIFSRFIKPCLDRWLKKISTPKA